MARQVDKSKVVVKIKTPKPRYKVLTFREYCENGMSHRK